MDNLITIRVYTDSPHILADKINKSVFCGEFENKQNGERFEFAENRLIFLSYDLRKIAMLSQFILKKHPSQEIQIYFGYGSFVSMRETSKDPICWVGGAFK